jgi:hypothetical protein
MDDLVDYRSEMVGYTRLKEIARTNVFFLEFTSQVALYVERDQHTIGQDNG